jgi:hypothetical protein
MFNAPNRKSHVEILNFGFLHLFPSQQHPPKQNLPFMCLANSVETSAKVTDMAPVVDSISCFKTKTAALTLCLLRLSDVTYHEFRSLLPLIRLVVASWWWWLYTSSSFLISFIATIKFGICKLKYEIICAHASVCLTISYYTIEVALYMR